MIPTVVVAGSEAVCMLSSRSRIDEIETESFQMSRWLDGLELSLWWMSVLWTVRGFLCGSRAKYDDQH